MSCGAASARTTSSTVPDACGSTSGCGLADEPVARRPLPSSSPGLPHGVLGIGKGRRRTLHRGAAVVLLQQPVEDLHTRSRADRPAAHLAVGVEAVLQRDVVPAVGGHHGLVEFEALRYARFQRITTYETIDLLSMAVADGDVTDKQAYEVMVHMSERVARCGYLDRRPS